MDGLYEAIGTLASVAHANGDTIESNTYPDNTGNDNHGLDILHRGHYYRFRAVPQEPKFTVGSPFSFVPRLQEQYNRDHIDDRIDAEFTLLTEDEQEAVIEKILRADLEIATEHEDEFKTVFQDEVGPTRASILRLTYGEDELWNGVFIRDEPSVFS